MIILNIKNKIFDFIFNLHLNLKSLILNLFEHHPSGRGSINNIKPHKIFINETGLYEILLKSTKPLAEIFTRKLLIEVIVPSGRICLGQNVLNYASN